MHQALVAAVAFALGLAGCFGGGKHGSADPFTCPDGTVVTAEQIEADGRHHEPGFLAASLCPTPPAVLLTGLPVSLTAYHQAQFTWVVDNGSVPHGHSMLTSIRYALRSVPAAEASLTSYPEEIIKKEHQNLPVTFRGNLTFSQPGKVYLRAYAQVQGDGYPSRDLWSEEVVLEVLAVQPTGTVRDVTHAPGLVAGETTPADLPDLVLGDALRLVNEDVLDHTLTLVNGPQGAVCTAIAAARQASSEPCVLTVPGNYEYETDDQQPATVTVRVSVPAQPA